MSVDLAIYDIAGKAVRLLVDEVKNLGSYIAEWDEEDENEVRVCSGVYFCVLQIEDRKLTKKVLFFH